MSETNINKPEELNIVDDSLKNSGKDEEFMNEPPKVDVNAENTEHTHQHEDNTIKKKYGGLLAKRHPLISKDHERAFFDSADWALNKQGMQKSKGPLEALRPKLEPSPHQQLRSRSAYARPDDPKVDDDDDNTENISDDQRSKLEPDEVESKASDDKC